MKEIANKWNGQTFITDDQALTISVSGVVTAYSSLQEFQAAKKAITQVTWLYYREPEPWAPVPAPWGQACWIGRPAGIGRQWNGDEPSMPYGRNGFVVAETATVRVWAHRRLAGRQVNVKDCPNADEPAKGYVQITVAGVPVLPDSPVWTPDQTFVRTRAEENGTADQKGDGDDGDLYVEFFC